jgi:hypothetical protein
MSMSMIIWDVVCQCKQLFDIANIDNIANVSVSDFAITIDEAMSVKAMVGNFLLLESYICILLFARFTPKYK